MHDDAFSAKANANRLALTYVYPQHLNAHTSMLLAAKGHTFLPAVTNDLSFVAFVAYHVTIQCSV